MREHCAYCKYSFEPRVWFFKLDGGVNFPGRSVPKLIRLCSACDVQFISLSDLTRDKIYKKAQHAS